MDDPNHLLHVLISLKCIAKFSLESFLSPLNVNKTSGKVTPVYSLTAHAGASPMRFMSRLQPRARLPIRLASCGDHAAHSTLVSLGGVLCPRHSFPMLLSCFAACALNILP